MKIKGVCRPIPTKYAERIYNENKNVFVAKQCSNKVFNGDKFIIYESHGAKAYTGWADIKLIKMMKTRQIMRKYKNKIMVTSEEFKEYSKDNDLMCIIEFENFEKFQKPIKPKRFVTVAGKYIYEDEFEMIKKNKD